MATVKRYPDEDIDSLIRRFKRKVNKEGIIGDIRSHEVYYKPSTVKHQHDTTVQHKIAKKKKA